MNGLQSILAYAGMCVIVMIFLAVFGAPIWSIVLAPIWVPLAIIGVVFGLFLALGALCSILLAALAPILVAVFLVAVLIVATSETQI